MRKQIYLAEFLATFQLVFVVTFAITYAQETKMYGDLVISLLAGIMVFLGIILFARVSGAHMNPAVTLFMLLMEEIKTKTALLMMASQFGASILASLIVKQLSSPSSTLGITQTKLSIWETWGLEFLLTFFLIFAILLIYRKSNLVIAIVAGTVIFIEAYLAGPFTGASMNPARSLGPALVSGHFENLWIYLTATSAAVIPVYFLSKLIYKNS